MKEITKWIADDGSEWSTRDKCFARECQINTVNRIMSRLKPIPKDFNWDGYVQQSENTIHIVKKELFHVVDNENLLKRQFKKYREEGFKTDNDIIDIPSSWFCSVLEGPLGKAYHRLYCIDIDCREWNQPYYAVNLGTGKMFENKTEDEDK